MPCQVIHLGAALNPGFRKRLRVVSKLAYHLPGNFTLRVPRPPPSTIDGNEAVQQRVQRGMTAMEGSVGLVKGSSSNEDTYEHVAEAVRVDSVVTRDVCMLKADVEGYEPQVLRSASALFQHHRVAHVQLELTKSGRSRDQRCAAVQMLEHLVQRGYELRHVHKSIAKSTLGNLPPIGTWPAATAAHVATLWPFPRSAERSIAEAFNSEFGFSTNMIARSTTNDPRLQERTAAEWPLVRCIDWRNGTGHAPLGGAAGLGDVRQGARIAHVGRGPRLRSTRATTRTTTTHRTC